MNWKINTLLIGVMLLSVGCAIATPRRYIVVKPNTEPSGAWIYTEGSPNRSFSYSQIITDSDMEAGRLELPNFIFEKPGFEKYTWDPDPVLLTKENLEIFRTPGGYWHNLPPVKLAQDYSYSGPEIKNKIKLTINSEPRGARVYQQGKYMGVTPLGLIYEIGNSSYQSGIFRCLPLVVVHDTCLSETQRLDLRIKPDWKYEQGKTFEYASLFDLKRDPDYRPPVTVTNQSTIPNSLNVNVKKEKDLLDYTQQGAETYLLLDTITSLLGGP